MTCVNLQSSAIVIVATSSTLICSTVAIRDLLCAGATIKIPSHSSELPVPPLCLPEPRPVQTERRLLSFLCGGTALEWSWYWTT